MSAENINVTIIKSLNHLDIITNINDKRILSEQFPNQEVALKDRRQVCLSYKVLSLIYSVGGLGAFIGAADLLIEADGHLTVAKIAVSGLGLGFAAWSSIAVGKNKDKINILTKQIEVLKEGIEFDK